MMIRLALLVLLSFTTIAMAADQPVPDAVLDVKKKYDSAVAEELKKQSEGSKPIVAEYSKKLQKIFESETKAGNLEPSLLLQAEIARIAKGDGGKAGKLPPGDATMALKEYETAVAKLKQDTNLKLKELNAGFLRELIDIEKTETKATKLESALAVKNFRLQLEKSDVAAIRGSSSEPKKVDKLKRPDLKAKEWKKQNSGIEIWDEKIGEGEAVKKGAKVKVHYTGWLTDDKETIFDSSVKRGKPIEFELEGLIKGWQEGIPGMKPGGTRLLKIPPELAYGSKPRGEIPADSTLIFRIELLK